MSFLRNTLIVTLLNIIGLVLSFLVTIIITSKFGASYYMDSYSAAIIIPNYISVVLGGALSYTFIPIFVKKSQDYNNWDLVNNIISIFILILGLIILMGIWLAPEIMKTIAPGFKDKQIAFSSSLLRLYFPIILFSCLNELLASIFYSKNLFLTPLINKLITPIVTILIIFTSSSHLNVKNLIHASVITSILQLIFLLFSLMKKEGYTYAFKININDKDVSQLLKLITPLILSSLLYKLFPIFDSIFLSKLPVGGYSRINYAYKLQLIIGSIINSIFSIQVFSLFSKYAANKEYYKIKDKIFIIVRSMLFISIPISVVVLLFGQNIIRLLLERDNFINTDTVLVSNYLKIYILALPAISIGAIISNGLYALSDTKSIMIVGIFETFFYLFICFLTFSSLKASSIPVAYVLNFNISVIILFFILLKKLNQGGGVDLIRSLLKIVALSFTICIIFYIIVKLTNPNDLIILFYCIIAILLNITIAKILKFQEVIIIYEKISQFTNKN